MPDARPALHVAVCITMMTALGSAAASAQSVEQQPAVASSLSQVRQRVPLGAVVVLSEKGGGVLQGTLAAASDESLELEVLGDRHTFAADAIERVQWQHADSLLNGVLVGAAIGAIPGIYWLAADPNECAGLCSEDYALIAGGALAGALVDRAFHRLITVYAAGADRGRVSLAFSPAIRRGRTGVQVALLF
jgi:hypothetical protein